MAGGCWARRAWPGWAEPCWDELGTIGLGWAELGYARMRWGGAGLGCAMCSDGIKCAMCGVIRAPLPQQHFAYWGPGPQTRPYSSSCFAYWSPKPEPLFSCFQFCFNLFDGAGPGRVDSPGMLLSKSSVNSDYLLGSGAGEFRNVALIRTTYLVAGPVNFEK